MKEETIITDHFVSGKRLGCLGGSQAEHEPATWYSCETNQPTSSSNVILKFINSSDKIKRSNSWFAEQCVSFLIFKTTSSSKIIYKEGRYANCD